MSFIKLGSFFFWSGEKACSSQAGVYDNGKNCVVGMWLRKGQGTVSELRELSLSWAKNVQFWTPSL